ncbi:MAG: VTT domain-containing protein [Sandaracinaceae bacterium]|nr:VTT domain-containing protein [Sandaracinaceae bacterium]
MGGLDDRLDDPVRARAARGRGRRPRGARRAPAGVDPPLPLDHPAFLVCVRWLPMGFHLANVAAGARGVPARRQLWIAAVGSIPGAVLWAGVGAGARLL